jgi:hypothetical protein
VVNSSEAHRSETAALYSTRDENDQAQPSHQVISLREFPMTDLPSEEAPFDIQTEPIFSSHHDEGKEENRQDPPLFAEKIDFDGIDGVSEVDLTLSVGEGLPLERMEPEGESASLEELASLVEDINDETEPIDASAGEEEEAVFDLDDLKGDEMGDVDMIIQEKSYR